MYEDDERNDARRKDMARLKHLFSPIRIGSMEVENRVVMPGMTMGFGVDEEGYPTDQLVAFYRLAHPFPDVAGTIK